MTFWEESMITRLVLLVAYERLVSKESVIPRRGAGQTLNFATKQASNFHR